MSFWPRAARALTVAPWIRRRKIRVSRFSAVLFGLFLVACGERDFFASLPLNGDNAHALGTGGDPNGSESMGDGDEAGDGDAASGGTVGFGGSLPPSGRAPRPTLRVNGTQLLGRCDENVMLRGANEMVIWSSERDGQPWFDEMSKLGANAVRIVWLAEGSAEELDQVIANAIGAGLIPVVEMHRLEFDDVELDASDDKLPGLEHISKIRTLISC